MKNIQEGVAYKGNDNIIRDVISIDNFRVSYRTVTDKGYTKIVGNIGIRNFRYFYSKEVVA